MTKTKQDKEEVQPLFQYRLRFLLNYLKNDSAEKIHT